MPNLVFLPMDTELIKSISLGMNWPIDRKVWQFPIMVSLMSS